ncbi:MAG: S8 family peptidase [Gaiellaceae bacterium]
MRRSLRRALAAFFSAGALLGPAAHAESPSGASPPHSGHAFVPPRLPTPGGLQLFARQSPIILQLTPDAPRAADTVLRSARAEPIGPQLRIWRLGGPGATRAAARLQRLHALRAVEPDRVLRPGPALATWPPSDPLSAQQWWVPTIGANAVVPPAAGVPVTDVDTGLDFSHPEFAGRPNTVALNAQTTTGDEDEAHGTAVASVIAAPENGVGIVGVYPQAELQAFDASPDQLLDHGSIISGVLTAASRHAGVINLSLESTSRDFVFQEAVAAAFGEGSLVVASAGNEGANGNPVVYPASYPHVLTVAATTKADDPAAFSSSSNAVDLAAPGVDIPIAVPLWLNPSGYEIADGTSFAAPLVSGGAAWVWTERPTLDVTQIFELMRRSARDVWRPGWDKDTGFGVLNIPNALSFPAPAVDPGEPNDDVYLVKPNGLFRDGTAFILGGSRRSTAFGARLDATEDPEDVYRVALPPHSRLRVRVSASVPTNVELWGPKTRTVYEKGAAKRRDLVMARGPSRAPQVSATNSSGKTRVTYVDVYLGKGVLDGRYSLRASLTPL